MPDINLQNNVPLAPYTTFKVGGAAECFAIVNNTEDLIKLLSSDAARQHISVISYGSNTLVSDRGVAGLTICVRGGSLEIDQNQIIADAGVWWDDIVTAAITHGLWGIEFMSQVPGSIGAATFINITAYGQSIGPSIAWVDVWDADQQASRRIDQGELVWDYKQSVFQTGALKNTIILRVCLKLNTSAQDTLSYQKALDVASDIGADVTTLAGRRKTIVESRERAGSIWKPDDPTSSRTAGSFFRNPVVSEQVAEQVIRHDETGKTAEQIKRMNQIHGGTTLRVSSAHVMLAAGFSRGQLWGNVKLNDKNLLKIEALEGATASDIYSVAQEIIATCKSRLGITLQPEAEFLGIF